MNIKDAEIQSVINQASATILDIPGITGIALGGGHVIVYVERITSGILQKIPTKINGAEIEVKSSGKLRMLSLMQTPLQERILSRTSQIRPVLGGYSCGCPQVTAGTFSGTVRDKQTGEKLGLSNNHVCFDDETEILTGNGWKLFDEITKKDGVATLSPIGTLEYQHPTAIQRIRYSGQMISFYGRFYNQLVTPSHRMYVLHTHVHHPELRRRDSKGKFLPENSASEKYEVMFASEVHQLVQTSKSHSNVKFVKTCDWDTKKSNLFSLPEVRYIKGKDHNIRKPIDYMLWCEFMGWYLSEGSCAVNPNGEYMISIRNLNINHLKRIHEVAKKMGFNPCICKGGAVVVNSKQLYKYVKQFGHCRDKFIPKDIKSLPKPYLESILNAFVLGDGHRFENDRITCTSFSKQLIDDFQEVCIKLGMTTKVTVKITGEESYAPNNPNYILSAYKNWVHPEIFHSDVEQYSGMVYDCTVPNSIILVRRNGMPVWSGNCLGAKWGTQEGFMNNPIYQPGVFDGGTAEDTIGHTVRGAPVELVPAENLIDACVFRPSNPTILSDEVADLGVPGYAVDPTIGILGIKSGRTTGTNESTIESIGATIDIDGFGVARFTDQIMFRPSFAEGGDSGSICLDVNGNVLGLVFAGSDEVTAVCRSKHIENLLDVSFGNGVPPTVGKAGLSFLPLAIGAIITGLAL